jgi:fumarate hydratase class II
LVSGRDDQEFRIETDTMGEVRVPKDAYWGAQTQRALDVFEISSLRFLRPLIRALGIVKLAAAQANMDLQLLDYRKGKVIAVAAKEVIEGRLDLHFPLDIFQTGSGTSTNMNANEVIANRAAELLGGKRGDKSVVHPNDDVNMGQSTNDVFPTTIHIAAVEAVERELKPQVQRLYSSLSNKAKEFADIVKSGRTHLQDAVPMTLGQEFSGYADAIKHDLERITRGESSLWDLALGGTAVGTGLNTHSKFAQIAIGHVNKITGLNFRNAENRFEALQSRNGTLELSGATRTLASSLMRISRDLRLLNSGPNTGLAEIHLPSIEPGSSIMPGKVNPVVPEATALVAARVFGNDLTVTVAAQNGELELNMMMPIIAYSLLESIECEANMCRILAEKCVDGIQADRERCRFYAERSLSLITALAPTIGYDKAAAVFKEALEVGKSIPEIILKNGILTANQLKEKLDLRKMTEGGRL